MSFQKRDWQQHIRVDWATIKTVYVTRSFKVASLLKKYPEVFQRTMKSFRAHLHFKEGSKPKCQNSTGQGLFLLLLRM